MSEEQKVVINLETGERGGRYVASVGEHAFAGELTYRRAAPDRVIANHTEVPPHLREHGIALKLVQRLVADARAEGFTIVPACSYVDAQRRRHPEWADVFA